MSKILELKSADYQEAKTTIAGAAVVAGEYVNLNGVHGFYLVDAAIGDEAIVVVKAPKVKAVKQAALAINEGDIVYFDSAADEVDKTNTNVLCGHCVEAALAADTHVMVNWDGMAAFLKL